MIDPSQSIYYLSYSCLCVALVVTFIKVKSLEGITITTKEFKTFQNTFLTSYALMLLAEMLATASFYHSFIHLNHSLESTSRLYVVTIIATLVFSLLFEIVDLGSRRDKCIISASLYAVAMLAILMSEGHLHFSFLGRLVFGAASALHHPSFESYAVHEHTNRGFPDDWLTQTFTLLTHAVALVAAVSGTIGQSAASTGVLGVIGLCFTVFVASALHIFVTWSKDVNTPKFSISGFLFNSQQTLNAAINSRPMLLLLGISALFESSVMIFTFYWAPWITSLVVDSASDFDTQVLPYEIIFSSYVVISIVGNYGYQLFGAQTQSFDILVQGILFGSSACFFLGAIFQTSSFAFFISLVIQCCVGGYWPCIGALRGRLIVPELRSSTILFTRILTTFFAAIVLSLIHHSPMLVLVACAAFNGLAGYLHHILSQVGYIVCLS